MCPLLEHSSKLLNEECFFNWFLFVFDFRGENQFQWSSILSNSRVKSQTSKFKFLARECENLIFWKLLETSTICTFCCLSFHILINFFSAVDSRQKVFNFLIAHLQSHECIKLLFNELIARLAIKKISFIICVKIYIENFLTSFWNDPLCHPTKFFSLFLVTLGTKLRAVAKFLTCIINWIASNCAKTR